MAAGYPSSSLCCLETKPQCQTESQAAVLEVNLLTWVLMVMQQVIVHAGWCDSTWLSGP